MDELSDAHEPCTVVARACLRVVACGAERSREFGCGEWRFESSNENGSRASDGLMGGQISQRAGACLHCP